MAKAKSQVAQISEHIVEIRYDANAKILDYRGSLAEELKEYMGLPKWRITQDRVDIHDEETTQRAFVSHRNCGFVLHNPTTDHFFPDKATKFLSFFFGKKELFDTNIPIGRIGLKLRFLTSYPGTFDELAKAFSERYLGLTDRAKEIIDAELTDVAAPLNFRDELGNFNTNSGPMEASQISENFNWADEVPDVGLYYDIDYWVNPSGSMDRNAVLSKVRAFAKQAWYRHSRIAELIIGE